MLDTLLEHALKEWVVIREAPGAFIICVALASILIFFGVEWFHGERSATQDERIKLLTERLDESRLSVKTVTEAAKGAFSKTANLRLHMYGDDRTPTRIGSDNIWRWFYYRTIIVGLEKETSNEKRQDIMTTLFLSFGNPVLVGTLEVGSPDIRIPLYEVKEFNNRFAIIAFNGAMSQGTLQIDVHQ